MRFCNKQLFSALLAIFTTAALAWPAPQNNNVKKSYQTKTAGQKQNSNLSAADRKFIIQAAQGGMAEVELGKLAIEKASNDDVKQFGKHMIDDHSKANDELKQLAAKKGINLPTSTDRGDQAVYNHLAKLSGDQFDKAYMGDMVKDHTKDVSEFKRASQTVQDAELKAWINKTLPVLESHLSMAQNTDAKIKVAPTGIKPK
jgi:putative membrane protein